MRKISEENVQITLKFRQLICDNLRIKCVSDEKKISEENVKIYPKNVDNLLLICDNLKIKGIVHIFFFKFSVSSHIMNYNGVMWYS